MATRERGSVRWHRGGWELRVREGTRRTTRRVPGPNSRSGRADAVKALEALLAEVDAGHDDLTVSGLLAAYIESEGHLWKPSTRQKAPGLARSISDTSIATMPVAELRQKHIKAAWAEVRAKGRAPGTIRRYHTLLSGALSYAVTTEIVPANVALGLRLGAVQTTRVDELPTLGDVFPAARRLDLPRLRSLVLVALGTGARRGELAALRWQDVDLANGTVRIAAAISADERSSPKNPSSKRVVTIDPSTVATLKTWKAHAQEHALAMGHRLSDRDPIWSADDDPTRPWPPRAISNCWDARRAGVGLVGLRLHDIRHVHATALIRAGVPVHVVSRRLGHASAAMTLDVYTHVLPGDDAAAAVVIAEAAGVGPAPGSEAGGPWPTPIVQEMATAATRA